MAFKYLIIALCSLLAGFLIYKEVTRHNKGLMWARILASTIAVVSLAMLILPFSYTVTSASRANELILVTPGADSEMLDKAGNTVLYASDSLVLKEHKNAGFKYLPDLDYFLKDNPEVNIIQIYGYGLNSAQLDKLRSYELDFHFPAQHPDGITSCNWNSNLKSAEALAVQGVYNNTLEKPVQLILKGLGASLDSTTIAAKTTSPFSFKSIPPVQGRAVYQLLAMQGKKNLSSEKIPFEVGSPEPLKIMVLASAPDFEFKFLKNWLYENKYAITVRTTISKNKYSSDYLNMDRNEVHNLNGKLLQKFDVLIADEKEISSISQAEKTALAAASENGLGVIIRADPEKPATFFSRSFSFYSQNDQKSKSGIPQLWDQTVLQPLTSDQILFIRARDGERPLVNDQYSRILVSSKINGKGKILASAISATYPWVLSGNRKEYTMFWSALISNAVKRSNEKENWSVTPAFPATGAENTIELQTGSEYPPTILVNGFNLQPEQDIVMSSEWTAPFWTDKSGWNSIIVNREPIQSFYVYNNSDWGSLKKENILRDNTAFATNNPKQNNILVKSENTLKKTVSGWITLSLFVISISFLWFELKFINKD